MAMLMEAPRTEYFKHLPHICSAARHWKSIDGETLARKLGKIFVAHNVVNEFGLVLLHRHFDMDEKEILVETFNSAENISVALPWSIKDTLAVPSDESLMTNYKLAPGKYIVPQTWTFAKDSDSPTLIAYEFLSHESELPPPPVDFTTELFAALKEYGLESVLGLRRLGHMLNTSSWETTPDGIKANVTVYGMDPPKDIVRELMIKVVFAFDEQGELKFSGQSCNHCGNCCNHCGFCIG